MTACRVSTSCPSGGPARQRIGAGERVRGPAAGGGEQQRQRRRRGEQHAAPRHDVGHTGKLPRAFDRVAGPSYPRDGSTPDRLGPNPAGRGRGGRDARRPASRAQTSRQRRTRSAQAGPRQAVKPASQGQPAARRWPAGSVDEDKIADVIRSGGRRRRHGPGVGPGERRGRRRLLRVVVDSDQGVSLDDAAAISRELSAALDSDAGDGRLPVHARGLLARRGPPADRAAGTGGARWDAWSR